MYNNKKITRMKNLLKIAAVILIAVLVCSTGANAQTEKAQKKEAKKEQQANKDALKAKAIKDARKEAKKLEKEGWKSMSLPIAKQIEDLWLKQYEKDDNGYPRYIVSTNQVIANTMSTAQMQLENIAKTRIAGAISTNIGSQAKIALANQEISQKEAASITKVIENSINGVAQKLGRIVKILEIYRDKPNNNTEMRISIIYDMKTALTLARQIILEELKNDLEINQAQLEKMMGIDNLMECSPKIIPDEVIN
jgi:hypothetical protein